MDKKLFTQRLIELRGERSRHSVAKDLFLKDQTLEKYEKGDTLPNIEKAAEIAQYYGVSTDYLLGLTDIQSPDTDIQAICEYTGLSEEAVSILHSFKADPAHYKYLFLLDILLRDNVYSSESILEYLRLYLIGTFDYVSIDFKEDYAKSMLSDTIINDLKQYYSQKTDDIMRNAYFTHLLTKLIELRKQIEKTRIGKPLSDYKKNPRPNDEHSDGE